MKINFTMIVALLLLFVNSTKAQSKAFTVTGKVISFDESLPLEGVSIHVKETTSYSRTQAGGRYTIEVPEENNVLVFELKDYETQEVLISGKKQYDVVLKRNGGNSGTIIHHNKSDWHVGNDRKNSETVASINTNNQ